MAKQKRKHPKRVRIKASDLLDLPLWKQLTLHRVVTCLSLMRTTGLSFTQAVREAQTTPSTVLKYASSALAFGMTGRWAVKDEDDLPRLMRILTPDVQLELVVEGSRDASLVSEHSNAVRKYLITNDSSVLRPFRGRTIRSGGREYRLATDPRTLRKLGYAGEVSCEEIYVLVA